jgi:filamentous hemagglutinin family protein
VKCISSSASCISRVSNASRFGSGQRAIARLLLASFLSLSSLPVTSVAPIGAQQWEDPNHTTFGDDVHLDNSLDGLETEFTIDSDQTTIGWQDLQQPADNTLSFTFTNPSDQSTVLNYIGAQHPSNLNGTVECAGCTVAFANPYGVYIGGQAIIDVGNLALIAGEIDQIDFLATGALDAQLEGGITNDGQILADGNVFLLGREVINNGTIHSDSGALLIIGGDRIAGLDLDALTSLLVGEGVHVVADLAGGSISNNGLLAAPNATLAAARIANHGAIEIADGTLQMVSADSVLFVRFDDPISVSIPRTDIQADSDTGDSGPTYAIENDGRIDAGLGHVRLSASDPLGFSIRQGTTGSIRAQRIEIEGGDDGRVELSGRLDASNRRPGGSGGEIDVSGSIIVLENAHLDASGSRGGGTIHVGGEQQGGGDLQRALAVVVDQDSTIRADALEEGDGGRVIVFSEGLTSIDGQLSATGGEEGGDGGFVETSGLARFAISKTPDVSAPAGKAGSWLIDPYDICITSGATGCGFVDPDATSIADAIDAILDPDFDVSIFDGIIRTVDTSVIDPALIARALAVGTDVTLSTQAFGDPTGTDRGDITLEESIQILNADTLEGTVATLTLLAAGNVLINADILSGTAGEDPNLELNVALRANDFDQDDRTQPFSFDRIRGDVVINGDIESGGGDVSALGISIYQDAASEIRTLGGDVAFSSGTVDSGGIAGTVNGSADDPISTDDPTPVATFFPDPDYPTTYAPVALTIDGTIDTSDGTRPGGDILFEANSVNVRIGAEHDVVTAELNIGSGATLISGGGDIALRGGGEPRSNNDVGFAANVRVDGTISSCATALCDGDEIGGAVSIDAYHVDPTGGPQLNATFVEADPSDPTRGEGGLIIVDVGTGGIRTGGGALSIGSDDTRQISIDGVLDTTGLSDLDEQGLMQITALDLKAIDSPNHPFGEGQISIGTQSPTRLSTAGLFIEGRSVTTSDGVGGNSVDIDIANASSAELADTTVGELRISGSKSLDFGIGTTLRAESIVLEAATAPIDLTEAERSSADPALRFRGGNGLGEAGVLLQADRVSISTGDGTSPTANLFAEALVDDQGVPTDFAVSRSAFGTYEGLQLESYDAPGGRPEETLIAQDAAFTISNAPVVGDSELNLVGAFEASTIGADGQRITLESSDGVLTIEDASALNNDVGAMPGSDAGKSWVTLLGGLLLPNAPDPIPSPETIPTPNSVVFGDDGGLTALATPFDVEGLVVSSPGDMTIDDQVAQSVGTVNELTFEAGRDTDVDGASGRGTLTVGDAATALLLRAGESLALNAGATGFGDLVFESTPTETITLSANDLSVRAGAAFGSENTNTNDRSRIVGLASTDVALRDAAGNPFGSDASPADVAFSYRQDARIESATDLPSLAQFGLLQADGFRDARDVVYSVQSDKSAIDLDDDDPATNEGDRFRDAALRLIGTAEGLQQSILVSDEFSFQGDSVEIGGTGNFTYNASMSDAFNRANTNPNAEMTIRSGLNGTGNLNFATGTNIDAAKVRLIAGDGTEGGNTSFIDARNVTFDLSGAAPDSKIFVYQQDNPTLSTVHLPTLSQFVGGVGGAPDVLAIRSDSGSLSFTNLDFAALPIDTTGSIRRLVLEADSIELIQNDGANPNLDLESPAGLNLRIRTNELELVADRGTEDEDGGKVFFGSTSSVTVGNDDAFDAETLLVEAFDRESEDATVANLSSLSEDAEGVVDFDLADGRAPTTISIEQNGGVERVHLPDAASISGFLARTLEDDSDDLPIATTYAVNSRFGPVEISPSKVNGSALQLFGTSGSASGPEGSAFDFEAGDYVLDTLLATTEDSIEIFENTTITVTELLSLAAGVIDQPNEVVVSPLGSLRFGAGAAAGSIDLTANRINLTAGTRSALTQPDGSDADFDRDLVDEANLPTIVVDGLRSIRRSGDFKGSAILLAQNAGLDSASSLALVQALVGGPMWERADLISLQGALEVASIDDWVNITESLTLETTLEGSIVADLEGHLVQLGDFLGDLVFISNDITIKTEDPNKQLQLATSNIEFRSTSTDADLQRTPDDDRFRLRDDPDALDRPIIRIQQVADFDATSALPLPEQYTVNRTVFDFFTGVTTTLGPRTNLNTLDIELETTGVGVTLTLDDAIRSRVMGSNLTLKSAGDVSIDLNGAAAGFDTLDAAALALASLDVRTNFEQAGVGNIFFTIAGFPTAAQDASGFTPSMIETLGDQRFDGNLALESSLSNRGRDITITGDVVAMAGSGLLLQTSGKVNFQRNIGLTGIVAGFDEPLDHLTVLFENGSSKTPNVEFGVREDLDGDGIFETPVNSNQTVSVLNDIRFEADNATVDTPGVRDASAPFATIGKALGNLSFLLNGSTTPGETSDFIMGTGEKLSVGGNVEITAISGEVRLGDVSALELGVTANRIELARRGTGTYFDAVGETQSDRGPTISANVIRFENGLGQAITPVLVGAGKDTVFGVPNPFAPSTLPRFLDQFSVFEIHPDGRLLTASDFRFLAGASGIAQQIPTLPPVGSSRSDLSGAFGPEDVPQPGPHINERREIVHPERLGELGVTPHAMSSEVQLARLNGAAIIDDSDLSAGLEKISVTEARLDAQDVETAIALYEKLFGADGERAANVRSTLQTALDRYLEETRARRVIGFELRRFVKNRPSTLIEAYETLETLDDLFRYHRRLGLSPGEYRSIQREWLREIQPEGITLDEFSETIHPSRYVRGSDILDIFGR